MYLCITHNGAGSAHDILCSTDMGCYGDNITFEDSVRDCCVQEDVLSVGYRGGKVCVLCYGMFTVKSIIAKIICCMIFYPVLQTSLHHVILQYCTP